MPQRKQPSDEERAKRADDLRTFIRKHEWSIVRLSVRSGISTQTIYRYLSGEIAMPEAARKAMEWANDHTARKSRGGEARARMLQRLGREP